MIPASNLTPREREVLTFLMGEITRRGYPPSLKALAQGVGLDKRTVGYHLRQLDDKGFVRRVPYQHNQIRVRRNTDGRRVKLMFQEVA